MTLVVGLLSPNYVIQVSDRQLVTLEGDGSVRQREGEFNKAVLYCNVMAFAYCGLAEMGPRRQRTDLWMADRFNAVGHVDQGELLAHLVKEATERMKHPLFQRLSKAQRRHAFMAVGWAQIDGGGDLEPYLSLVSNFHAPERGGIELADARPEFQIAHQHRLGPGAVTYAFWIGADLTKREQKFLHDAVKDLDPRRSEYPHQAVRALVGQVRSVAGRLETVGKGLLVNILPREAAEDRGPNLMLAGGPEPGHQTFLYVPPDQDTAIVYGPTYACGGVQMANFEARGLR